MLRAIVLFLFASLAIADNYGAIAYAVYAGVYGYANNYATAAEAEQAALEDCQTNLGNRSGECIIESTFKDQYAALAIAPDQGNYAIRVSSHKHIAQAEAMDACDMHACHCNLAITVDTIEKVLSQ